MLKKIKNYILNAAMNISMPKAVMDQQTTIVKDSSKEMSTSDGSSDFHLGYHAHGNQNKTKQNKNNKMSFKESYRLELASAHIFFPDDWRYPASWQ